MKRALLFLLVFAGIVLPAAAAREKSTAAQPLEKGGLVLTFDDGINIENWVKQIPLFEKYGARVTFFIDRPDRLDAKQKNGLKSLAKAGHEIACHGFRHIKAVEAIKEKGAAAYINGEITPAIDSLKALGFTPRSFAYPMSNNNDESDALLEKFFKRARTGSGVKSGQVFAQTDKFFTPADKTAGRFCLTGRSLDQSDDARLEKEVFPALERVKARNEIVVFYTHDIVTGTPRSKNHIKAEIVEKILARASDMGLAFYRMSDLP